MTFTSLTYFIFLFVVLFLFAILPLQKRWVLLLVSSYIFYAYLNAPHLLIALAIVTVVSFCCGLQIYKVNAPTLKKYWLWSGIITNLTVLLLLKYLPFLADNLNLVLRHTLIAHADYSIQPLIAIGVSYFVFQGISYLIDIYLEVLEPETHLGYFALSMSFFPKLLQGPIERGENLLPQLHEMAPISVDNLRAGTNRFLWGMFKKVAIADHLATFVDPVYQNVHSYSGFSLVIATYLFALQIYFDFSGYTDMALGAARCFNIRLTQNFNSPYVATSVADFWRRWHISFSSWILDYIFKPLQFSFRDWRRWGTPLALMVTFAASGIWHGASWCFVSWGVLHGFYLSFATLYKKQKQKLCKAFGLEKSAILKAWQIFVTFHLVCFSWIFFRSQSISDALYVAWQPVVGIQRLFSPMTSRNFEWVKQIFLGKAPQEFIGIMLLVVVAAGIRFLDQRTAKHQDQVGELTGLAELPVWAKGCVYGAICYVIAFNGAGSQSFIYLQF